MKVNRNYRIFLAVITLCVLFAPGIILAAKQVTVKVSQLDIQAGYICQRIDLEYYAKPAVTLNDIAYTSAGSLREDAIPANHADFDIMLGKDRKEPFAVVRIPAYSYDDNGGIRQ